MLPVKQIVINEEETIEIKKMPAGKFAKLVLAMDKLPSKATEILNFDELEKLDYETLFAKAPVLIAVAQDEVFNLVSVATGIDKIRFDDEEGDIGLDDALAIIEAILEVNNVKTIVNRVKNVLKVFRAKAQ